MKSTRHPFYDPFHDLRVKAEERVYLACLLTKKFNLVGKVKVSELGNKYYIEIPEQCSPVNGLLPSPVAVANFFLSLGIYTVSKQPNPRISFSYLTTTRITMDSSRYEDVIRGLLLSKDIDPKPGVNYPRF